MAEKIESIKEVFEQSKFSKMDRSKMTTVDFLDELGMIASYVSRMIRYHTRQLESDVSPQKSR